MEEAHPTSTPKQAQTDTFAVFGDQSAQLDATTNLVLIARVEVPRYAKREAGAAELDAGQREVLAVKFAIEDEHTSPPPMMVEGEEFMVMSDLDSAMREVPYDAGNPTLNSVWNPQEE